jgi:tetratricopeptide (TPR) repeat protein
MSNRPRFLLWAVILAACIGPLWASWVRFRHRHRPDLAQAIALAEANHFDEAEALVRDYIRRDPGSNEARMLAGQLALNRPVPPVPEGQLPDPKPAVIALEHLRRIKPDNPYLAALVELYRGKAEYRLGRLDAAETAWLAALQHDPRVPEAGWHLLELYYLGGRTEDARRLALRLHAVEPDPGDRVRYLLELLRQDTHPPAPASLVNWFRPIVANNPDEVHARLALGVALARAGSVEEGKEVLRPVLENSPESPEGWEAWLTVLDESGEVEQLAAAVDHLPGTLADSPQFARYRARIFQERGDWKSAERVYRLALQAAPADHRLQYRLIRVLRNNGRIEEAERIERAYATYLSAKEEALPVYDEASAIKNHGLKPHRELYQRIADLRERLSLPDEALAWHRLVLLDEPQNSRSLAKVSELSRSGADSSDER